MGAGGPDGPGGELLPGHPGEVLGQHERSEVDANGLRRPHRPRGSRGPARRRWVISFQRDGDIEEEVDRLARRDKFFTNGISDYDGGHIAPVKDSEGNDLQIYGPPKG